MTLSNLAIRTQKVLADNSPAILTALGVAGTLTTAYLTGKASFKAAQIIEDELGIVIFDKKPPHASNKEIVLLVWKEYVPAAITAVLTVSCIIGANKIGARRAAAVAAAYTVSERAFSEYRGKVIEKLGEKKELAFRDELEQDRVRRDPISGKEVIFTGVGDALFYDSLTGRYFQSTMETVRKAMNDINEEIIHNMYASLSDFYNKIGLASTVYSDEVGWNTDHLMEVHFSGTLTEDDRPCISMTYNYSPFREYSDLH